MTEIKMLPLPEADDSVENHAQWPIVIVSDVWLQKSVQDYARAVAEHNVAAKDAEIEALRAEARDLRKRQAGWERHVAAAGCEYVRDGEHGVLVNRRAERLAEALREKADKWDRIGDEHGVRQFTGNDHKLFANELRALLRDYDQEGKG